MTAFLSDRAIGQLREIARRVLREEVGRLIDRKSGNQTGLNELIVKASTAGISERTTAGPGSGTGTIHFRSTGNTLTATTETVTVHNLALTAIKMNEFVTASQDLYGSLWAGQGLGRLQYVGKTTGNHTANTWATYNVHRLDDLTAPVILSGAAAKTIFSYNPTGVTLKADTLCGVWQVDGDPDEANREHYVFPIELEACLADAEHGVATDSILIGPGATLATSDRTVVLGDEATASGANDSVGVGYSVDLTDIEQTIIGASSVGSDGEQTGVGVSITFSGASSGESTSIGGKNTISNSDIVAIGWNIVASQNASVLIGNNSTGDARSVTIGHIAGAGRDSVSIGHDSNAGTGATVGGVALGEGANTNNNSNSMALGRNAACNDTDQCVIGSTGDTIKDFSVGPGMLRRFSGTVTTTDATATNLITFATTLGAYQFTGRVVGHTTSKAEGATYARIRSFLNSTGAANQIGSGWDVADESTSNVSNWNMAINSSTGQVRLRVTGSTAGKVNWYGTLDVLKVV